MDGERINVYRGTPLVQATASGTASGIADIALRAKYTIVSATSGGVAAAGELRLPTGDEDNLLGAGSTSWRVIGIGSYDQGRVGVHGNAGIVRGGVSDEVTFAGALSVAAQPRLTLTAELYGRHVSELRDIELSAEPHPTITGVDTSRLVAGASGQYRHRRDCRRQMERGRDDGPRWSRHVVIDRQRLDVADHADHRARSTRFPR